jgi:hypothetical protein
MRSRANLLFFNPILRRKVARGAGRRFQYLLFLMIENLHNYTVRSALLRRGNLF